MDRRSSSILSRQVGWVACLLSLTVITAGSGRTVAHCSDDALLVVLELHDERLDVLALGRPILDAFLGVAVEVLLLLVDKGLSLECISL